jgi:hypothetical protein
MLRVQKARDGEDAIGPTRTGLKTRDACATQIFAALVAAAAHIGVHSWLKSKNSVDTFQCIALKRHSTSGPPRE